MVSIVKTARFAHVTRGSLRIKNENFKQINNFKKNVLVVETQFNIIKCSILFKTFMKFFLV